MIALTENAVSAIRNLTEQPAVPDGSGLRIATGTVPVTEDTAEESRVLTLAVETQPQEGDQVVDAGGARLFLEEDAATYLDDKALDAQVDSAGAISFQVEQQPQ